MYCPDCKAEYRPGFTECYDCGVDLVYELPEEESAEEHHSHWKEQSADLVAVYSTFNPADVMMIKSLLDVEEIIYNFQGELFKGAGVFIAPVMLFVAKHDAQKVVDMIKDHGLE